MKRQFLDLILKSYDEELSETERKNLERALADSAELRQEKERIEEIRNQITANTKQSFSEGFADRVMNRISEKGPQRESDLFFESLFSVFRPVAIAALLLIGVFITYNMTATEDISLKGAYAIADVYVEDAFDPIIELTAE